MTDERKNEIWAMLPEDFKDWMQREWTRAHDAFIENSNNPRVETHIAILREYFGASNLNGEEIKGNCINCTEDGVSHSKTQSKSAESVETGSNSQTNSQAAKKVDYSQYRLNLAKEIAVAMIAANWEAADIPHDAVEDANEIVKRLKETE